jgi:hypothetical protein
MTARLKRVALFGEGIYSRSPIVTRQRRLNCYLEVRPDGDKAKIVLYGTPGLRLLFNASPALNNPLRGLIGNLTALYGVTGNQFGSYSSSGALLEAGSIGSTTGVVGMALNPTQVLVVDGSAGYIYSVNTGHVTQIPATQAFPNGARSACYCNGFFLAEDPGTNQFFVSNLNDGTLWSGLSFAAAVQAIDGIVAVDTLGGLAVIFSSGHCEFWQNVGAIQEPFQYITNSAQMYGLAAVNGRCHAANAIVFLANTNGGSFQNSSGGLQICSIAGYAVKVVSTSDIDNILQTMARTSTVTDCTAFSYQIDQHTFCQFNFPTANRSLLLDMATGFWSEAQSGVAAGYAARHLGNLAAGAYGGAYVADYSNGNVYAFDPNVYTDNGNTIVRELVTKTGVEDFNTYRISQIYLDMRTGVGLPSPAAQGYAPVVQLQVARDMRDFGAPRLFQLGQQGQYMQRVLSRRWGRARTSTLRVYMTDPVPFEITSGAMLTSMRQGRRATGQASTSRSA